ncbi:MAG: hypothetical protein ACO3F2_07050 [Roseiflexaceae bacterium]
MLQVLKASHIIFIACFVMILMPRVVAAHGIVAGGAQVIEVDAGTYPLRIEVEVPTGAPTVLNARILPVKPFVGDANVTLTAVHRNSQTMSTQQVDVPADQRTIVVIAVDITHIGPWDLWIEVKDARGESGLFSVPITVLPTTTPLLTIPLFVAFGVLALVLTTSIIWPTPRPWIQALYAHAFTGTLVSVLILGGLYAWPTINVEWNTPLNQSRPYATTVMRADQQKLTIQLFDGSTGLPVDDLVPHHQALIHLVMIEQTTHYFVHAHPVRTDPGVYKLDITNVPSGVYDVAIELERLGSGSQVLRSEVEWSGGRSASQPSHDFIAIPFETVIDGYAVAVAVLGDINAGVPTSIQVAVSKDGTPVRALDYWLGMRGHMILRDPAGSMFGHVHAAGAMNEDFQPVAIPGHTVDFIYAFPQAQTYQLWLQVQVDGRILTVPARITVTQ